jgi:hypothetical protein
MISIYFQHYLKVHAEKVFQCEKCLKGFSTEAAKTHHTRICGIKFICSCNHSYDSYEALRTHAKRSSHTFDEKFKSYGKYVLIKNNIISKILNIAVEWVLFLLHIWGGFRFKFLAWDCAIVTQVLRINVKIQVFQKVTTFLCFHLCMYVCMYAWVYSHFTPGKEPLVPIG